MRQSTFLGLLMAKGRQHAQPYPAPCGGIRPSDLCCPLADAELAALALSLAAILLTHADVAGEG
jgi:hypothetical protein